MNESGGPLFSAAMLLDPGLTQAALRRFKIFPVVKMENPIWFLQKESNRKGM
jgi:hypothetical protein